MALNKALIGNRISELRKKRGLSQQLLSEMVDISLSSMSYIETGTKGMSLETFVAMANALNVSADELLLDVLTNTVRVSNHAFASLLSDASEYEKRVMLDVAASTKTALRKHKAYLLNHK
ncbi:MAG: helix-turn-helix transcriptional regulator [Clostridia bacterium]|nr:helix-turn-helix transcriptional regulator [Clostridia bacterium]